MVMKTICHSKKEPTGIVCKRWNGCPHPEICQDHCIDDDIIQENVNRKENTDIVYKDKESKNNPFASLADLKLK